eukprot:jgi/Mesen1/9457/ME000627S08835
MVVALVNQAPSHRCDLKDSITPRLKRERSYTGRSLARSLSSAGIDDRGWSPLHVASRMGKFSEVQRLLEEGADVNEPTKGPKIPGATPLHLAAMGGHVSVMDLLLDEGANIEARTRGSCAWTPLLHAAKEKNKRAIRFLVSNGAFLAPDMCDTRFNPPLHYCPGLEYAYQVRDRFNASSSSSSGEGEVL